jgi:hypothetical protein
MAHLDTPYKENLHLYLHAKSEHHPAQERAVLTTLVQCARTLSDPENLRGEIQHIKCVFHRTGTLTLASGNPYIQNRSHKQRMKKPTAKATLPY